jgi:molecular chaperone GrpE
MKDRLLRLQADFDNFRRRTQREKAEWSLTANENIIGELLPVIDHFELGLKNSMEHKTDLAVHHGIQMVYDQLITTLKKFGLTPLDAHESGFDPMHHEAVAHVPSDEYPADEIIQQTRRGWKLGDKLLRPVQVVVSSGPGAPRDDEMRGGTSDKKEGN